MANITYPAWADTKENKWLYCRRMLWKLRELHNVMGSWYKDGITLAKYNQLPAKIRNRYSYVAKLSQADWHDFTNLWETYSIAVWEKLNTIRALAEDDSNSDVDIDRDIS